ncbi:MAG: pectate lyase [Liquorilactobacillus nagelii]|jgi:pectate lyase|uniref:Pectate lyase n=2 Tax=Liquorilactobacillus nagelii TaxID=82688 RepID=A0A3Q8CM28_9LACO|nr:pectate lyase [Liquorilactobacillus nagelii]AUJ31971.1 pectate lyase [Liquorilactobacillus nagelii]
MERLKKGRSLMIGCGIILSVVCMVIVFAPKNVSSDITTLGKQTGSATVGFGSATTGGSVAKSSETFVVSNRQQLINALGSKNNVVSKIIYLKGKIDMNENSSGQDYTANDYVKGTNYNFNSYLTTYNPKTYGKKEPSGIQENARLQAQKKQAAQIEINIPANTTLIGEPGAIIVGGNLVVKQNNVIIRNIYFESPYDFFPQWDPLDGSSGNWNSQYDSITVKGAQNVWIDHNTFNDGSHLDSQDGTYFGRDYQHHDGMTNISDGADKITISYNVFENHDKTMLIGSSDSKTSDTGKLHVTLTHNFFENTVQRTPRVRFGEVHVLNNLYENNGSSSYKFQYAWGVGKNSQILAENNVLNIAKVSANSVLSKLGGNQFSDRGTILNGNSVKVAAINKESNISWKPSYFYNLDSSSEVEKKVLSNAGSDVLK